MEELTFTELMIMIKGIAYCEVEEWNRTRNLMLAMLSPYMKQKMQADEFMPLIIDESYQEKEELTTEIGNDEVAWFNKFVENYKKENG